MTFGLLIPLCYLMGAIPFGLLVARLVRRVDVRQYGSGNTGASNVLRAAGKWPALAVLVLDVGKGVLAVVLAKTIDPSHLFFDQRRTGMSPVSICIAIC